VSARRAIVTGAGGFVGAALARRLLHNGATVTAVVRPESDLWRLEDVRDDLEVVALDLREAAAVREEFAARRPDDVFHLAAHGAYSWQDDPAAVLATNVLGSAAVLEAAAAAGAAAVVQAGSSSEYGAQDHAPAEHELPAPNSAYAVSKVAATQYGQWLARDRGQAVTTLRLYSIYGPWEDPRRLMPVLVEHARRGAWPPLADPSTPRDFVYVDDACEAFLRAAARARPGDAAVYNVASGTQTTLRELVDAARDVFGVAEEPRWGDYGARTWDTTVWVGDPARARSELGWTATTTLGDGLRAFGAWQAERA
jgi:dolichol-phosphate mannosyltransferase